MGLSPSPASPAAPAAADGGGLDMRRCMVTTVSLSGGEPMGPRSCSSVAALSRNFPARISLISVVALGVWLDAAPGLLPQLVSRLSFSAPTVVDASYRFGPTSTPSTRRKAYAERSRGPPSPQRTARVTTWSTHSRTHAHHVMSKSDERQHLLVRSRCAEPVARRDTHRRTSTTHRPRR